MWVGKREGGRGRETHGKKGSTVENARDKDRS